MKQSPRLLIIKSFVFILFSAIICLFVYNMTYRQEPGLDKLATDFKAANRADNIDSMLELYCLDDIDKFSLVRLKDALKYELGLPIKQIEFEPLSGAPEETIEFFHNGIAYGPTLRPRYKMRVTYEDQGRFESLFTIGKNTSGDWKIITAKPLPTPHF